MDVRGIILNIFLESVISSCLSSQIRRRWKEEILSKYFD